jgi:CRISPR/Cas system-associated protein Cas10 (large subunit of type III CRISPR-Cas system)
MFEATAQELDMAQTKLAQTRSDLEQERKRNMRLHRLRMAAEEEIEKAKETLNILSSEGERERERSSEYERTIEDLKEDLRDANERVENAGTYCVLCLCLIWHFQDLPDVVFFFVLLT